MEQRRALAAEAKSEQPSGHDEERGLFGNSTSTAAKAPLADEAADAAQTLAWHVHACTAPVHAGWVPAWLNPRATKKTHAILTDVSGQARTGECTAVLGPSGCGKTTLLECIALRRRGFTGSIYKNGKPAGPLYLESMCFVPQVDVFFSHLTPREHLIFHAITRCVTALSRRGADGKRPTVDAIVEAAIQQVGLGKCANTRIGGTMGSGIAAGHYAGISGGERKRLAIATELLGEPRILLLDEPTTGLDSNMGALICRLLANLATDHSTPNGSDGRIVMASIHGPSTRMLKAFSHLLVLTEHGGRVAYHGPTAQAEAFFSVALGKGRPRELNAAEFLISAVSDLQCVDDLPSLVGASMNSKGGNTRSANLLVRSDAPARVAAAFDAAQTHKLALPAATRHAVAPICGNRAIRASSLTLFRANLWRATLEVVRAPVVAGVLVLNAVIIGGLFGGLYYQQVVSSWRNTMCCIFALMVCMMVLTLGHCSPHIPSQWPLLLREYQVGANSVGPYLAALSLADVPRLLLISCCCLLPFFLSGMDALPNATTFLGQFFLLHFLLVAGASSVSYFGTGSTGVPVIGFVIAVTIVTPMILFSGLLYQRSKIAGGLQWLADTSMMNYAYGGTIDAFCREQAQSNNCKFILSFLEITPGEYQRDVVRLLLLVLGFRLLTYFMLSTRLMLAR